MSEVTGVNFDELTVIEDEITEELIQAYIDGHKKAMLDLGLDAEAFDIDLYDLDNALNLVVAGKTYLERIRDGSDIERLTETEQHRMFNTGTYDAVKGIPGVMKTWVTMADDRVRDTHEYLEMQRVPMEARFYTFDGDSARFPGDFELAQNNVSCRCVLSLSWA